MSNATQTSDTAAVVLAFALMLVVSAAIGGLGYLAVRLVS